MATEIRVPSIGASATRASVGRWFKRVGDPVSLNEPLVEIEADGATIEVPASVTGVLSDILLKDGETVKTGMLLGTITTFGGGAKTSGGG
jgi:2-oxoglutarate dehydrogenase E2 component (dihydrolipoamide succinyltransferase)